MSDAGVQIRRRALAALLVAAVLTGVSVWLQSGLTPESAAPFLRAMRWLVLAGMLLLCGGITCRRQMNTAFLSVCGGVALGAALVMFVLYGGMEDMSVAGTGTALSLMSCLWTALPAACAVRAAVLAFGRALRDEPGAHRLVLRLGAAALLLLIAVLTAAGVMLRFFRAAA